MSIEKISFLSKHKSIILLLCISLLIRILIFIRFQPWSAEVLQHQILIFDSLGYHQLALCIQQYFSFCGDAFRTPGYPFFLAIIYNLSGSHPYVAILVQLFLNLLSILLMYKIGGELFSKKAGLISALLFSMDLHHTIFIYSILTETLYTAIFLTALLIFLRAIRSNKPKLFFIAGLLYGVSSLVRPISQFYIYCVIIFVLLWYLKNRKKAIILALLLISGYSISVAPWCYRNYNTYGHFSLSNIKGYNLLFWNASYFESKRQHKPIEEINNNFIDTLKSMGWRPDANPFDKEHYDGLLANKLIKAHFADYLKIHLIGTVKIHLSVGTQSLTDVLHIPSKKWSEEDKYNNGVLALIKKFFATKTIYEIALGLFVALFLLIVYSLAAIGIYVMVKKREVLLMLFLLGSAAYFALISGIISYARYRLPSIPFYILLASAGIVYLIEKRKKTS